MKSKGMYCIVGSDVSVVTQKQMNLAKIFNRLPMIMLIVGRSGLIDGIYSGHEKLFFDPADYGFKNFVDILFTPGWEGLSAGEKKAVKTLGESFGKDGALFEEIRKGLPTEISLPLSSSEAAAVKVRIVYQPLIYAGRLEQLFVALTSLSS